MLWEASCWSKLSSDKQEHPHPCTHRGMDKLPQQLLDNVVQSMAPQLKMLNRCEFQNLEPRRWCVCKGMGWNVVVCDLMSPCVYLTSVHEKSNPVDDETDEDEYNNNNESSKGFCVRDSYGVVRTTIRRLSYLTTDAQENQRPYSEKTKVYKNTAKNK
ncbi:hypothetical protein TNCV_2421971 [Trichonephila clavipes]|nr:hypothetical protein TNCV_2421971 [Trichonephila clavipes]